MTSHVLIVGISGGSGSGKTTVAHALLNRLGADKAAYIPHDAYYKSLPEMPIIGGEIVNFDHPDALRTSLLINHLRQLKRAEPADIPIYDFATHNRSDRVRRVEPLPVIIVEGILIFADRELRDLLDIKIYVDTEPDVRLVRRLHIDLEQRGRSFDSAAHQYLHSVRPMHLEFVEPSKQYADLIIPEGGHNEAAIGIVADHIQSKIAVHQNASARY